jgi:Uncharacterised nucleotidyltransferase
MSERVRALLDVLADPARGSALDGPGWTALVAAARATNLLGSLAVRIDHAGVAVPSEVRRHLVGAVQLSERQHLSVAWESRLVAETLSGTDVVLLKGAAYVLGYPTLAAGRVFGDLDVLVPYTALNSVESRLMLAGWTSANRNEYDQRYYRQWMHELPPLVHVKRGTVLDVHHAILPRTSRRTPDPAAFIARSRLLVAIPGLRIPSPEDLLIHSLIHLMHEGELHNGLRDLCDIDRMVRLFGAVEGFWPRLVEIAAGNDLSAPLGQALALARTILGSPVPADALARLLPDPGVAASALQRIYARALLAPLPLRGAVWEARLAHILIYLRGHALRMPPVMLARHLAVKAWMRMRPPGGDKTAA